MKQKIKTSVIISIILFWLGAIFLLSQLAKVSHGDHEMCCCIGFSGC